MKAQKGSKKSIIIVVIILAAIGIGYFYYSGTKPTDSGSGLSVESAESAVVGARVLSLLQQINALHIDTTLFEDKAYLNLIDYAVEIPDVEVGRPNPFAPLPGEQLIKPTTATR